MALKTGFTFANLWGLVSIDKMILLFVLTELISFGIGGVIMGLFLKLNQKNHL